MTFDFTVSVSHIITVAGFAAAFAWNFMALKTKTERAIEEAKTAVEEAKKSQDMNITLSNRLSSLELQMLKEYASLSHISSIEARLTTQMQQMNEELRELNKFLRSGNKN